MDLEQRILAIEKKLGIIRDSSCQSCDAYKVGHEYIYKQDGDFVCQYVPHGKSIVIANAAEATRADRYVVSTDALPVASDNACYVVSTDALPVVSDDAIRETAHIAVTAARKAEANKYAAEAYAARTTKFSEASFSPPY